MTELKKDGTRYYWCKCAATIRDDGLASTSQRMATGRRRVKRSLAKIQRRSRGGILFWNWQSAASLPSFDSLAACFYTRF